MEFWFRFFLLLTHQVPARDMPGQPCRSRWETGRGITLVRLGCFPCCSWETCPTSLPGHPLPVWAMFYYCGLVTESIPCVVLPLLKEASKENLDRGIIRSAEGDTGQHGHTEDTSSSKYSVGIHLTTAQGLWQPRWLLHARKGSPTAKVPLPGWPRACRLLLIQSWFEQQGGFIQEFCAATSSQFPT